MKKWTLEEDNIIRNNWSKNFYGISRIIHRTEKAIKSRYYSHIKPQDDDANLINQSKQNINTMKTTFKPLVKSEPERKYPYVGYSKKTNKVILFSEPFTGTVLQSDNLSVYAIGYYNENWVECDFTVIPNCTITFESE